MADNGEAGEQPRQDEGEVAKGSDQGGEYIPGSIVLTDMQT